MNDNDNAPAPTGQKPLLHGLLGQNYPRRHSFTDPSSPAPPGTGAFHRQPSIPSSIHAARFQSSPEGRGEDEEEDMSSVVSEITLNIREEGGGASGTELGVGPGASCSSAPERGAFRVETASWDDESGDESDKKEEKGVLMETKSEVQRPAREARREGELAVSFSSLATAKRGNSTAPARGWGRRATWTKCFSSPSVKDWRWPSAARIPEGTQEKVSIDEVIDLKLLVANQQETIDGLSSKLRDLEKALELANGQLRGACMHVAQALEAENRDLTAQLSRSRDREAGLERELAAQKRRADMRAELDTATLDHFREREISLMKELASHRKRASVDTASTVSSHEERSVATSKSFDKSVATSRSFGWY